VVVVEVAAGQAARLVADQVEVMAQQVALMAVAVAHLTVVILAWVAVEQYVLFGPETCVNSHLHIRVIYLISLLMYLL
jgi:hypothetical protein